jgi:putative addiction module component (TIGR02574 family)
MSTRVLRDEILSLSPEARLRLLEEVWDSLADTASVSVPSWHVAELEQRLASPLEQSAESWNDLKRRLSSP